MNSYSSIALLQRQKTEYALTMLVVTLGVAGIVALSWRGAAALDPHSLVKPMLAMFGITLVVWVLLPLSRHWAVLTRRASPKYFVDFQKDPPAEWLERPARTYNNLMQAPTLFYVVSLLMIVTPWADQAQMELAWIFVALRAAHALIYLALNHLMLRFASFALSSFVLWAMWARFALIAPYN